MTTTHDGGEAILAALEAAGAQFLFSSPGSEWSPVWEALARRREEGRDGIEYLDLTHETVAVTMATGFGLVTRRGQGVLLHAGPGLLQGACAIHGALLAGVPMVIASSESIGYGDGRHDPGGQWYRNLSVVGGPQAMATPWVKWSNQVGDIGVLSNMVGRASQLAHRAPAGPTYLNIPVEVLLDEWDPTNLVQPVSTGGRTVSARAELERAVDRICAAERALIVAETVGRRPGGMQALVDFAETFNLAVIEPASAVCTNFPRGHRLHAGDAVEPYMDTADLIVLVECRAPFYPPSRLPSGDVIVVDEVPQRPHMVYQVLGADQYVGGDTAANLVAMAEMGRSRPDIGATDARATWATYLAGGESDAISAAETEAAASPGIDPVDLIVAMRRAFAELDPLICDETITHGRAVRRHLLRSTPDSYFYVQGGLGQGIGVALGAKLASGERLVALTIGDGSFLYNPIVQSLMASKEYGLPILVVIFNNGQYYSMKLNHLRNYPNGTAVATGDFRGVDLSNQPSLASLAAPFGMHGERVDQLDDLEAALDRATTSVIAGTTAILDVAVTR